jgi:penicillin-binding protein 2
VNERARLRLVVLRVLMLSLLVSLVARLYYIQVVDQWKFKSIVTKTQQSQLLTPPVRGQILDAAGRPLASNRSQLVISVDRVELYKHPFAAETTLVKLGMLLKMPYDELLNRITPCNQYTARGCWLGEAYAPIPVSSDATPAVAQQIVEHLEEFPGVTVQPEPIRHYDAPAGANAAQILGYLQPISPAETKLPQFANYDRTQLVGRTGLEKQYESVLAGQAGVRTVTLDPRNQISGTVSETPPVPGDNLVLSIDAQVQALAEKSLADAIHADALVPRTAKTGLSVADKGAAIVMDAQTGRVVAAATYPNYDPSVWVGSISQKQFTAISTAKGEPLNNWAVSGQFPPGSTFKLVTTVGAIKDGLTSFSGAADNNCTSQENVGGQIFHNYEGVGLGPLTLHDVIVQSCDTTFYQWAKDEYAADTAAVKAHQKPKETQANLARKFGFGSPTGIDLPAESSGAILDRAAKYAAWQRDRAMYCALAVSKKQTAYQRAIAAENCAPSGGNYNPGDQANFNIGQGSVLVTPLQEAEAYSALINGGKLFSPTLAWGVLGADGAVKSTITPKVRGTLGVDPSILQNIQSAMCEVPKKGTAAATFAGFDFSKVTVCGKTGTAQTTTGRDDTSWFSSFGGPPSDPHKYVVVAVIPDGGMGAAAGAHTVRAIWEGMYGLNGKTPIEVPTTLPHFRSDGTLVRHVPFVKVVPTQTVTPSGSASPGASSTSGATPSTGATTTGTHTTTSPTGAPPSRTPSATPTPTRPPPTRGPSPTATALLFLAPFAIPRRRTRRRP